VRVAARAAHQIVTAYRGTYGFSPSLTRLNTALRIAQVFTSLALLNGAVASGRSRGWLARGAFRGISVLSARFQPGGRLAAFTNPLLPTPELICRVQQVIEEFPKSFESHYVSHLADLENFNLDTGILEGDSPDYPLTQSAMRELERRSH
jgi:hypothetical protein